MVHIFVLLSLLVALWPTPPAPTEQSTGAQVAEATSKPVWLLGNCQIRLAPRLVEDNGLSAHIQDNRIGSIPFVFERTKASFAARRNAWDQMIARGEFPYGKPLPPIERVDIEHGDLVLLRGRFVTESLRTTVYTGVRRVDGERDFEYTYFIAEDDFVLCRHDAISIDQNGRELTIRVASEVLRQAVPDVQILVHEGSLRVEECAMVTTILSDQQVNEQKISVPASMDLDNFRVLITNIPAVESAESKCAIANALWLPPYPLDEAWAKAVPPFAIAIDARLPHEGVMADDRPYWIKTWGLLDGKERELLGGLPNKRGVELPHEQPVQPSR